MKKSSIITILIIFILPVALYYFIKNPSESAISHADPAVNMPKVLQFTSTMCYDCKKLENEIAPLRQQYKGKIVFRKYNVSSRTGQINQMISQYSINVVPTLIFLDKKGYYVRKTEGYVSRNQIKQYLDALIN